MNAADLNAGIVPFIVGVAGGSGSGKTTIANQLVEQIGDDAVVLSSDQYYCDQPELSPQERAELNFDHPDAIDFDLLVSHLLMLKRSEQVSVPQYCFSTHLRKESVETLEPRPVVIVEGILLFTNTAVQNTTDLMLFVEADSDVRYQRRLARDTKERGRTELSVLRQWETTVAPMYEQFVAPTALDAHLTIRTDGDDPNANESVVHFLAGGIRAAIDSSAR